MRSAKRDWKYGSPIAGPFLSAATATDKDTGGRGAALQWNSAHVSAAMNAEQGMVRIQAQTIRPATPQRTAEAFCTEPTPTIAPVIVWVVDTGMPRWVARKSVIAPPVSAQKPPTGRSFVMRRPIVRTMRQQPDSVPSPIAAWQASTTQSGT